MDIRLKAPLAALRVGIGLTAALAGADKFFNLLADWGTYVSPPAAAVLPVSIDTFMGIVGVIELAVGVAVLTGWTRIGASAASAWLVGVAVNLRSRVSSTWRCETSSWRPRRSRWRGWRRTPARAVVRVQRGWRPAPPRGDSIDRRQPS